MITKKKLLERIEYLDDLTQKQSYLLELICKRLKQSGINFDSRLAEIESMFAIESDRVFEDGTWSKEIDEK